MKTSSTLLLASAAMIDASYLPVHMNTFKDRAVRCKPIDYTFQANVPYVENSPDPALLNFGGFQYRLPRGAKAGNLISFFGNFYAGQTKSTQVTTTTSSTSTSNEDPNAPSYSNGTASAIKSPTNQTIITTTFSQGNSSSAVAGGTGGNPDSSTSTSSSSSGAANSTAVATSNAMGDISIFTNATTAEASNQQSIENQRLASAASSCAADNEHATAEAEQITSVTYTTSSGTSINSEAYAACSAGTLAPTTSTSSSSSGSQASVSGVTAQVTCNGVTTTNTQLSTTYKVRVVGQFCPLNAPVPGFSGTIAGQRSAKSSAEC